MKWSHLLTAAPSVRINGLGTTLAVCAFAMNLLLLASAIQAQTVIFDGTSTTATSIEGLEVDGLFYNVTIPATTAEALYGLPPGTTFPFPGVFPCLEFGCEDANLAMLNVLVALDGAGADSVGTAAPGNLLFYLGFVVSDRGDSVWVINGQYLPGQQEWIGPGDPEGP